MKTQTMTNDTVERVSMALGTAMMLAWTMVIGIGGVVLLATIAFALLSNNVNLAIVASFLLFLPLAITGVWGISLAVGIVMKKSAVATIFLQSTEGEYSEHRARISYVPNYL
jgi:hypothetical protein